MYCGCATSEDVAGYLPTQHYSTYTTLSPLLFIRLRNYTCLDVDKSTRALLLISGTGKEKIGRADTQH